MPQSRVALICIYYFLDFPKSAIDCPNNIASKEYHTLETASSSAPKAAAIKGTTIDEIPIHTFLEVKSLVIM